MMTTDTCGCSRYTRMTSYPVVCCNAQYCSRIEARLLTTV
jgi:hypothetical protein